MHLANATSQNPGYDIQYDVRADPQSVKHYIGSFRVEFEDGKILLLSDSNKILKKYEGSPELNNFEQFHSLEKHEGSGDVRKYIGYNLHIHYDIRRVVNITHFKKCRLIFQAQQNTQLRPPLGNEQHGFGLNSKNVNERHTNKHLGYI